MKTSEALSALAMLAVMIGLTKAAPFILPALVFHPYEFFAVVLTLLAGAWVLSEKSAVNEKILSLLSRGAARLCATAFFFGTAHLPVRLNSSQGNQK